MVLFSAAGLLLADGEGGGRGPVGPLEMHPPGVSSGGDLTAKLTGNTLLDVSLYVILNHLTNERPVFRSRDIF